ncbi:hypothetical protein PROFUN_15659 [Planoprotostelium fungivorum]|uniref:non-specific serine/threonine protein kinase n=1 Tax=Planoprotostelium fungivorum TaxID=1890364 RepID=A0A2P6MUX6_9EUKA|nr:hypothetical protein PROFUN_15659 [Planoprotostelium fungivorum]
MEQNVYPFATMPQPHAMHQYEELRTIGRGTFGRAVLVRRRSGDPTRLVMKQIRLPDDADDVDKTSSEVHVLSMLSHPNIISYVDSFLDGDYLNIVMEYAEGGDLHQRIIHTRECREKFEESQIWDWALQLAEALHFVHSKNILHRDVKNQNLFLTGEGQIKLGDFGIAKVLETAKDLAQTIIGTPYNLSPEICNDKPYNAKSDIWAMGCCIYEIATLRRPFEASNLSALVLRIVNGTFVPLPTSYSSSLSSLVSCMLQNDPAKRPEAGEIVNFIKRYKSHAENPTVERPTRQIRPEVTREPRDSAKRAISPNPSPYSNPSSHAQKRPNSPHSTRKSPAHSPPTSPPTYVRAQLADKPAMPKLNMAAIQRETITLLQLPGSQSARSPEPRAPRVSILPRTRTNVSLAVSPRVHTNTTYTPPANRIRPTVTVSDYGSDRSDRSRISKSNEESPYRGRANSFDGEKSRIVEYKVNGREKEAARREKEQALSAERAIQRAEYLKQREQSRKVFMEQQRQHEANFKQILRTASPTVDRSALIKAGAHQHDDPPFVRWDP